MTHMIILAVISVCMIIFIKLRMNAFKRREYEFKRTGFKLMLGIQSIIELVQKHRGISNAIHSGNDKLKQQLFKIERDIETIIGGELKNDFKQFDQWESFLDHWPKLKQHALAGDLLPHNLMRQHNMMIEGQLSLLDDVTRFYDLHTVMLDRFIRMSEICLDTLRTAETIAQARGLGAGVCAKGKRDGSDNISLNYLKVSMASTTNQLFIELKSVNNDELQKVFASYSQSIKQSVESLVSVLEEEILQKKELSIQTQDYFRVATAPITELVGLFNYVVGYASEQYDKAH
jgi:hypothetical protein